MSCEQIGTELPLYNYGELGQEAEERVEHHLATCPACADELARLQSFDRLLAAGEATYSDDLLQRCRTDLTRALRSERPVTKHRDWLAGLREFMHMGVGLRIPAGALALIAVGFLAGKLAPGVIPGLGTGVQQAGIVNVRSVESDPSGSVKIGVENVSRNSLSGHIDDPHIRELLIAGMRDESNPGLRIEAVDILKDHAGSDDVRTELIDALLHDPNLAVRMAALEGLKPYAKENVVRGALATALRNDANAGIRVKCIDVLTANKDESLVGPMQEILRKEDTAYVRMRIANLLREMNASEGTF